MNNEEKILAILENIQANQAKMQADIADLKAGQLRIEIEHGNQLKALFDGYKQTYDVAVQIERHITAKDYSYNARLIPVN